MKEVVIVRSWSDKRATLGMLTVKGERHDPIFTLENPLRDTKEDSRIPAGRYACEPYSSNRFKDVYQVLDVPGRTLILFHYGNTEKDTEGCILLGLGAGLMNDDPAVKFSRFAMSLFWAMIQNESFNLTIIDGVPE